MTKHAFWQALVFTVIVFSLGVLLGFFLELRQSDSLYNSLVSSELNILDEQIRQRIITDNNVSCSTSKESLFLFADKIYEDAQYLEEIDGAGRISDLTTLHKRYDLLRTLLLLEADKLRVRCEGDFHIITYFYLYNNDDVEIASKQNYFSRQIFDLKLRHPDELILIPIAADTGVASVELYTKSLYIDSYPVLVIDGNKFVKELTTLDQLEDFVFNSGNSP